MRGLSGKTVVIAGGAGGIGTATSVRLGDEGAQVVVGDLDPAAAEAVAKQISGNGGTAVATDVDISDEASVQRLFEFAIATYGAIDGVHINAADLSIIGEDTNVLDIDLGIFDRTISVNLRGHVLCTRAALPLLLDRGGALVYTTSAAAFVGEPERPAYAIAKAGITALVRHIASRWGKSGIRANAIAPGLVLSPAVYENIGSDFQEMVLKGTRSKRLGYPEDVAGMVAYLLSDDGEWINGQILGVDGGATMR